MQKWSKKPGFKPGVVASGTRSDNVLSVVVVVCGVGGIAEEEAMELSAVSKLSSDMSTDKSGLITPTKMGNYMTKVMLTLSLLMTSNKKGHHFQAWGFAPNHVVYSCSL